MVPVGGGMCWENAPIPGSVGTRHPLQVYVKVSVPKGIQRVGHPGKRHLTKKMRVTSGETEPTSAVLSFSDLGLSNIPGKGPVLLRAPPAGHLGAQAQASFGCLGPALPAPGGPWARAVGAVPSDCGEAQESFCRVGSMAQSRRRPMSWLHFWKRMWPRR